ncbi:hypothetical protein [Natrinema longum]|uniref:Uncharacterized protein n=1 Tax=Natrinema longum TaxID=370324 RepID=A0A8A2UDS1_9EURY|nr:hypothetical protein [Natrinema longum]MBZ6496022.1 hypothetical protein [Natrinema longum]QSW86048.1 hypothetical protein J0X27_04230 [Natrinema longum]
MSKVRLAREVAQATGRSLDDAARYVGDVGPARARQAVDAAKKGGRTAKDLWKPAAGVGAVGAAGYGAYQFREQDVRRAEALAEQSDSSADFVEAIMNSDLPEGAKQDLIDRYTQSINENGGDGSSPDGGFIESLLEDFTDDIMTMVIGIIALVLVLNWALSQSSAGPSPIRIDSGGESS